MHVLIKDNFELFQVLAERNNRLVNYYNLSEVSFFCRCCLVLN